MRNINRAANDDWLDSSDDGFACYRFNYIGGSIYRLGNQRRILEMIKFTSESGAKLRIDPDDVAAVSSTRDPQLAEIMLQDGRKVRVLGTVADVFAELERDDKDE